MSLVSEIAADSPTHWWHMDSVAGGVIADAGNGTAVDLTVTGTLISAPGIADETGAQTFDGSNYATGTGTGSMPSGATPFTIGIFHKPSNISGSHTLIGFGSASTRQAAGIKLSGANYTAVTWGDDLVPNTIVALGEKSHLVMTYDGATTIKLYRNGVLIGTRALGGTLNVTASAPYVGRLGIGTLGEGYVGDLDEIYIITGTALSAARIAAHYYASRVVERCPYMNINSSPISPSVNNLIAQAINYPVNLLGI